MAAPLVWAVISRSVNKMGLFSQDIIESDVGNAKVVASVKMEEYVSLLQRNTEELSKRSRVFFLITVIIYE